MINAYAFDYYYITDGVMESESYYSITKAKIAICLDEIDWKKPSLSYEWSSKVVQKILNLFSEERL